ncbi:MAG TPA: cupin domain-containing protein [Thermomicrobiales bacterium]|nr:cupin domain-containing protein [Thermomicrobiales bacterium]
MTEIQPSPLSRHVRSLWTAECEYSGPLGSLTRLNATSFPILKRLSIKRLILQPGAIREPHWHANANELTYCVSGSVLVSLLDTADVFGAFTVGPGQVFHIDSGSLHSIEQLGPDPAELIVIFSHEQPEDFSLHGAFGAMTDAVLGNTYDLPAAAIAPLTRDTSSPILVGSEAPPDVSDRAGFGDPHAFDLEGQNAPLAFPYGSAKLAREQFWPALRDLAMYSLRIDPEGMREPHWHPETAELGYVVAGHARMTILSPDGSTDTYLVQPGDAYFVPRAYPHQIEVIGDEAIHFLVCFDQATPGDIGYRASVSALTTRVLAATFGVGEDAIPALPFTPVDPLIVHRENPVDPTTGQG